MSRLEHITLKNGTQISLEALESARISYVPCGVVDGKDQPLLAFAHLWGKRIHVTRETYGKKWNAYTTRDMTGVQLMTGFPTYRHGRTSYFYYYNSIDIEAHMIESYPEMVAEIQQLYESACEGEPCVIGTKSGGLRLDGFTEYVGKKLSFEDDDGMLLEVLADKCLARIDHRYTMIQGSILQMPVYPKSVLQEIHRLVSEIATKQISDGKPREIVEKSQIGDLNIDWDADGYSQYFPSKHCQETAHRSNRDTVRFKRYTDGSVSGICFNCGESWWEVKSKSRRKRKAPIRLRVDPDHHVKTENIESQQVKLTEALTDWEARTRDSDAQHILNVTLATGTGKTTVAVQSFERMLYVAKTVEEADQAYRIADELRRNAHRHKTRMWNRKREDWSTLPLGIEDNCRACIYPEICDGLAQRGHSPTHEFCLKYCPMLDECKQYGYLCQSGIEADIDSVFYSWDEVLFSDRRFESYVANILSEDKMLALDEANPISLLQHRIFDENELRDLIDIWNNVVMVPECMDLYDMLSMLLKNLSTENKPERIAKAIAKTVGHLADDKIAELDTLMTKIPIGVVYERSRGGDLLANVCYGNLTRLCLVTDDHEQPNKFQGTFPTVFVPENGVELGKYVPYMAYLEVLYHTKFVDIFHDTAHVPRRFDSFFADLKTFTDAESKACYRVEKTSDIHLYLPPSLNAPRGITLTASDKNDLMKEVYRPTNITVETLHGPPPPWKLGNKFFQIATGRYTQAAYIKTDKDGTVTEVKPRLKQVMRVLKLIADQMSILVVATIPLTEYLKATVVHPNLTFINFHHAEGRNDYQDRDAVIYFHFEQRPDETEKAARIAFPNAEELDFTREEMTLKTDGVELEGVMRYMDTRVQKVYDRECESRHMQTITRLRQMWHESKIAIGLSAEPVGGIPIAPVPFALEQLEAFLSDGGRLAEFDAYLEKQAERTVEEIADEEGVSERTAYRRKSEKGKMTKQEKVNEAYRLHTQENLTLQEIADRLGVKTHTTIARWLASFDF